MTVLRVLARLPHPRLSAVDIASWEPNVAPLLTNLGFLVRTVIAEQAVCPRCDGLHVFRRLSEDPLRMATVCPVAGVVIVPANYLQEWTIDVAALARWCGHQLGTQRDPVEVIPGLAWRWDRLLLAGTRRSLVIVRSTSDLVAATAWQRLGLVPRTILLALDAAPVVPDTVAPIAYAALVWSYADDDDGLRLNLDDLADDVIAAEHAQRTYQRPPAIRGGTRQRVLRLLTRELDDHIRSAQATVRQGSPLPPRPALRWLARAVGTSPATAHRCLCNDDTTPGRALRQLWAVAADDDAVRTFRSPPSPR